MSEEKVEEKKIEEIKTLSIEEQGNIVRNFISGVYDIFTGYGYYSPYTQNQNLVGLNNNPQIPTYDKILKALENAPVNYEELVGYSEFMETFDNIYRKLIDYYVGLLSFDIHYYPVKNDLTKEELNSKEFKDDFNRVEKFISNFNYKQFGNNIAKELLRREISYVFFRDSHSVIDSPIDIENGEDKIKKNEKFALQIMPQKYCKLTGYYDSGQPMYDFDMNYFLKGTIDINLFAPCFKRKFRDVFGDGNQNYNPSAQLNSRNGEFATWVQTSPVDGAYAFKFDLSNFRQVPKFASLLKSVIDNTTIENLQKDKNIASSYAMLVGQMPLMDNLKSGDNPNQFAIQPEFLGKLIGAISKSLMENIKPIPLPTEENKLMQYQEYNASMVRNQLLQTAGQGASASDMIFSDTKLGQFAEQQAIETDFALMQPIYWQFAEFMNYFVNRKLRKYKYEFSFSGLNRSFSRDRNFKQLTQLADKGMVMDESMWASTFEGMSPQGFRKSMMMANRGSLSSLLTPLLNLNTGTTSTKEVGNTEKTANESNDGGDVANDFK